MRNIQLETQEVHKVPFFKSFEENISAHFITPKLFIKTAPAHYILRFRPPPIARSTSTKVQRAQTYLEVRNTDCKIATWHPKENNYPCKCLRSTVEGSQGQDEGSKSRSEEKGEDFEKHCVSVPSATRPGRLVGLGAGCCWNQRGGVPSTTTTGALCLQSTLGSHCDLSWLRFR